jgi:hypothetical protein
MFNLSHLKKVLIPVFIGISAFSFAQSIKLNKPQTNFLKALINNDKIPLLLDFRMEGAEVRYTIDGSTPHTESSLYVDTLFIKKSCTLKARSFHKDFLPSDEIEVLFLKTGKSISSLKINQAHEAYKGNGSKSLLDRKFGTLSFKNDYLGYEGEAIVIEIEFDKKEKIKFVNLFTLVDQNAWIFSPSSIIITDEKGTLISSKNLTNANAPTDQKFELITVPCKGKFKKMNIIIDPIEQIPAWHSGSGGKPWIFIDEIIVE